MDPVALLISVVIVLLVAGAIIYCVQLIGLPDPWARIVQVIVALIVVIWLLRILVGAPLRLVVDGPLTWVG